MSDAVRWLDQYDRVVAAAAPHLPAHVLAEVARIGHDQRERRAYAGTVLLVGLAGGTGSGKSSLLNALAGEEVSPSGAMRPTTPQALAWVPAGSAPRLAGLFERFGITDVAVHHLEPPVAIIDLPDVDSVESRHRQAVAALLPIIDLVVWVLDPEKYRDRVLHAEHLEPLARYHRRLWFVLNQVDRVQEEDIPVLVDDLTAALVTDGVQDPVIWVAAADPPFGPPIGVEAVWEGLIGELESNPAIDPSVASELRRGLDLIAPYVQAVDFRSRWEEVSRRAARLWVSGHRSEAVRELRMFLIDLSADAPDIEPEVDLESLIGSATGDESGVARHFDMTLGRLVRDRLRARGTTRALADELALTLSRSD